MDRRFYPTNEGLQGLAVLSNVQIVYDDGTLLTSTGNQSPSILYMALTARAATYAAAQFKNGVI